MSLIEPNIWDKVKPYKTWIIYGDGSGWDIFVYPYQTAIRTPYPMARLTTLKTRTATPTATK